VGGARQFLGDFREGNPVTVVRLALVGEDEGHFIAATALVDATLLEKVDWLDGWIEHCRSWGGIRPEERWYKYDPNDANDLRPLVLDGVRVSVHGHIDGAPLKPEAGMWRRVLMLLSHCESPPDVVVLVRDMDGRQSRRDGMEQVRGAFAWPFRVVVAAPEPEVEAWHVSGFVAEDDDERKTLDILREELSFNPTTEPQRLTSHPNNAKTDAKLVLARLCGVDADRRLHCLHDRSRLRARGTSTGLTEFLDEIEERVVPTFGVAR
jgi:hypothetical protein